MIPLVKLRENLRFAKELREMIEVLKWATASQFRTFQQKRKRFDDFKAKLEDFLFVLDLCRVRHPFLRERSDLPKAILMITSNEGFIGGLNAQVINAGLQQAGNEDELIVVGERGARYLTEDQNRAFTVLPGIGDDITYLRAAAVRDLLVAKVMKREIGSVIVSYPFFMSLTIQRIDVVRLLPCYDIISQTETTTRRRASRGDVLIEPTQGVVVNALVQMWLMQRIYDIFWESKLSECAARLIHLEGSYEESLNESKKLMFEYFKHLHARSDKTIREIFASKLH
jgi:F-type H+-transporting ATPase subunit gamma